MPSVYDLKPKFQALLRPLANGVVRAGISPNQVTLLALAGSFVVGAMPVCPAHKPLWLLALPVWLFLRMALNAIDGMMAREHNRATPLGAVLNEFGDVLSDLALYLPLAALDESARWPVILFALGAALTEFCGVLTRALGGTRRYDGPMGKSDRAFVIGALATATAFWPGCLFEWWTWFFVAFAVLTGLTCWNRLARGLRELPAK